MRGHDDFIAGFEIQGKQREQQPHRAVCDANRVLDAKVSSQPLLELPQIALHDIRAAAEHVTHHGHHLVLDLLEQRGVVEERDLPTIQHQPSSPAVTSLDSQRNK